MPAALDHPTFVADDLRRSFAFYDAALGAVGLTRRAEFGDEEEDDPDVEAACWARADGGPVVLWVVAGADATRNAHLRLRADSRAEVEAFHAAAVAAGGTSRTRPRRWAIFRSGEYVAAVADRDGNVIEVVAPE